jgi:hypothetical protein
MPEVPAATGAGPAPEHGAPGDRLVRLGVVVTGMGMLISLVAILPLVTDLELPSTFWWLSMLTGVGLAMILVGLARNGRHRARSQRAARSTLR